MEKARILIHPSYNDDGYTSNLSLAKARMSKSDTINPAITFLQGNEQKAFPFTFPYGRSNERCSMERYRRC